MSKLNRFAVLLTTMGLVVGTCLFVAPQAASASGTVSWSTPERLSGADGRFHAVSCGAAGDCAGVGTDGSGQPTYSSEHAGGWGPATVLPGAGGGGGDLNGVSCSAVGACTAVGYDHESQPIVAVETGGTWGSLQRMSPGPIATGVFLANGVSCTAAGDCTAVGSDGSQPVYATETAGTWGSPTAIPGTPSGQGELYGVSCTAAGSCTAVGYTGASEPFVVTESAGVWGTPTALGGSPGGFGLLNAVSCTTVGSCTAVGSDGNNRAMFVTETAGVWGSPTELAGSPSSASYLLGVSCVSAGSCMAVGYDHAEQPLYSMETGGVWSTPAEVTGSPGGHGFFRGVSCLAAGSCTAMGDDGGQPIYSQSELISRSGMVTDAGSGLGIGGAAVRFWALNAPQPAATVLTAADGTFAAPLLAAGTYQVQLSKSGSYTATWYPGVANRRSATTFTVTGTPGELPTLVQAMEPLPTMSGVVTDSSAGFGLGGATVLAFNPDLSNTGIRAATNAVGAFSFSAATGNALPPGEYKLLAATPGFANGWFGGGADPSSAKTFVQPSSGASGVSLVEAPNATGDAGVAGTVTDRFSGNPVAGVNVRLWQAYTDTYATAKTDSSGHYVLGSLPSGYFQLQFAKAGSYPTEWWAGSSIRGTAVTIHTELATVTTVAIALG